MANKENMFTAAEVKKQIDEAVKSATVSAKNAERSRIKELMQKRAKSLTSGFSQTDIAAVKALNDFASYL